jgi:hypothetical protein
VVSIRARREARVRVSVRWPSATREVCEATRCMAGVIGVNDLITGAVRLQQHWNYDPEWLERMVHYGPDIVEVLNSVPDLHTRSLDEPLVVSRDVDPELLGRSRYYKEWVRPQGVLTGRRWIWHAGWRRLRERRVYRVPTVEDRAQSAHQDAAVVELADEKRKRA